jgi:23S rRNA (guanosine2251-2'-O)-methyltransferase
MNDKDRLIYGYNPLVEGLKSNLKFKTIYIYKGRSEGIHEIVSMAEAKGVSIRYVEKDFFEQRFAKGHQGLAAIVEKKTLISLEELLSIPSLKKEEPFFLILDSIEDPRNFGAILRVAEAGGIHGVVYQSRRSARINPLVAKSSVGALEHLNLVESVNIKYVIDKMKKAAIYIIGAEANAEKSLWNIDLSAPLSLIIGSEGRGLRKIIRERCDIIINIPLRGMVNSLNASVATGILIYETLRQRRLKKIGGN